MLDNNDAITDSTESAEASSDSAGAMRIDEVVSQAPPKSVLKVIESQNRQKKRRRKPPAWALKVASRMAATKHLFRTRIPGLFRRRRREIVTAVVSFFVHLTAGMLLAAMLLPVPSKSEVLQLLGVNPDANEATEEPVELAEIIQPSEIRDLDVNSTMKQMLAELDKGQQRNDIESPDDRDITLPLEDLTDVTEIPFVRGHFGGRSEAGRRAAISLYGGNAESEKSVSLGLAWLKSIQKPDGSWSFDEIGGASDPGNLTTTDMGATSLALLCFLGAGNTHRSESPNKDTVQKGLAYLLANAERGASGADLRGRSQGNSGMYVQGIATICICEAAALEREDKDLKRMASDAVKFIERAQNKVDGGWRYKPGDAGDTSVTGWQIMALQSARAGRIKVQGSTMLDVKEFLRAVQFESGAKYSYQPGTPPQDTMTAVGLLCRMYLGWKRDNPALIAGVQHLSKAGPRRGDIYYNYYATQVLHHWGGDLWKTWNLKMREELVSTQVKEGIAAGTWDARDPHGGAGGRIYQTTLSLLTLEVYYRHLPIYRRFDDKAADDSPAMETP